MRKTIYCLFVCIFFLTATGPAFSADMLWRLTHNDQDVLLIGKVQKINNGIYDINIAHVISGKAISGTIKVKISDEQTKSIGGINFNDKLLLSLDRSLWRYKIKGNLFKVSSLDYRKMQIVSPWSGSDKAALEYYVNSGGIYKEFFYKEDRVYVRIKPDIVNRIFPYPPITIDNKDNIVYGEDLDSANIDLNGDGVKDNIRFSCEFGDGNFVLYINNKVLKGSGCILEGYCKIVDINSKDKFKEIAIEERGPSDDYATAFYYYDGKRILPMGKIQGSFENGALKIGGLSKIKTMTRGKVLHTWFYPDSYKLSPNHLLEHINQKLYQMNTKVRIKRALPVQKSSTNSKITFTLKTGEEAIILASDDKEWCLIRNSKGQFGWFKINGLDGHQFFDGLCYAD